MMVQTRATAKRSRSGNDQVSQDDIVTLAQDEDPLPAKKLRRRDGPQGSKKSRQGKSGELLPLNLDVLYLIFSSVNPLDLLNLARSCKSFRWILMSKSSAFVWKAARLQVADLPDCPFDLSEPAYANLAFHPYCHVCGKYTSIIYWKIRRRYCSECRVERFSDFYSCPQAIWVALEFTRENVPLGKKHRSCHDKDLVNSVMQEYERSSNKEQFLKDKSKHYLAIYQHARDCERWRKVVAAERRDEQKLRRRERDTSILERLEQLGYGPEIVHFGRDSFRETRKKAFKPLTDKEWTQILPAWLKTMNHHRQLRLDRTVYEKRRSVLTSEYETYMRQWSPDTPTVDLLPRANDLARFPPFRNIIEAPEETKMDEKPFASAFAQLPVLANEWKKHLDAELAELVKIPPHLCSKDASFDLGTASGSRTPTKMIQTDPDKLRLACALFWTPRTDVHAHPDILFTSVIQYTNPVPDANAWERVGSIRNIIFFEEAPYIVRACELDPSVATADDMDRLDARVKCLVCKGPNADDAMDWRHAVQHAQRAHQRPSLAPLSGSPRWLLVRRGFWPVAGSIEREDVSSYTEHTERCLLCPPRAGDLMYHDKTVRHLRDWHGVKKVDVKRGVHYTYLGILNKPLVEGGYRMVVTLGVTPIDTCQIRST